MFDSLIIEFILNYDSNEWKCKTQDNLPECLHFGFLEELEFWHSLSHWDWYHWPANVGQVKADNRNRSSDEVELNKSKYISFIFSLVIFFQLNFWLDLLEKNKKTKVSKEQLACVPRLVFPGCQLFSYIASFLGSQSERRWWDSTICWTSSIHAISLNGE